MLKNKMRLLNFLILLSLGAIVLISFFGLNLTKIHAASAAPAIARFYSSDESNVYFEGQTITINANFNQIGLNVTADLTKVDKAMPMSMPATDNQSGTYTLTSPVLSGATMVIGSNIAIPFTVTDSSGNSVVILSSYTVDIRTYPLKTGADIAAPARLDARMSDGQVTLWWSEIPDADSILVRYTDAVGSPRQEEVPSTNTGLTIKNLKNNFHYTFLVAGRHASGTIGRAKTILVTPSVPVMAQAPVTPPAKSKKSVAASGTSSTTSAPPAPTVTPNVPATTPDTNAPASSSAPPTNNSKDWNRILLLISILIIAAGVAVGGYYSYEWYVNRKDTSDNENPKNKSRW